jgi:hypothetical protein
VELGELLGVIHIYPDFNQLLQLDRDFPRIYSFDKEGKIIYFGPMNKINTKDSTYENLGNYGGSTDIWYYYNLLDPQGSGPKGEADTYGMAVPDTDYLYVRLRLYDKLSSSSNWNMISSKTESDTNCDDVYVFDSVLTYLTTAVLDRDFKGETKHKIQDEDNGWDDTFYTDDSF